MAAKTPMTKFLNSVKWLISQQAFLVLSQNLVNLLTGWLIQTFTCVFVLFFQVFPQALQLEPLRKAFNMSGRNSWTPPPSILQRIVLLHSVLLNFLFFPLNAFSLEGKQKKKKKQNLKSLLLLSVYKVERVTVKKENHAFMF